MECIEVQNLMSDYSVGLIKGRRKAEMEKHLAACPSCAAELEKLSKVMALVEDVDAMEPPAGLWNGVYNKITQPVQRDSAWNRLRDVFRHKATGWSVAFAAAALAAVVLLTHMYNLGTQENYAANEYMQGHAIYASQEFLADQAALNSVATVAYREQVGGRR